MEDGLCLRQCASFAASARCSIGLHVLVIGAGIFGLKRCTVAACHCHGCKALKPQSWVVMVSFQSDHSYKQH